MTSSERACSDCYRHPLRRTPCSTRGGLLLLFRSTVKSQSTLVARADKSCSGIPSSWHKTAMVTNLHSLQQQTSWRKLWVNHWRKRKKIDGFYFDKSRTRCIGVKGGDFLIFTIMPPRFQVKTFPTGDKGNTENVKMAFSILWLFLKMFSRKYFL